MSSSSIQTIEIAARPERHSSSAESELFASVISNIGTECFSAKLLKYLDHRLGGVDHCALYYLDGKAPAKLGSASLADVNLCDRAMDVYLSGQHWHGDPLMTRVRNLPSRCAPTLTRMDIDRLPPSGLRDLVFRRIDVNDRLMLCGIGTVRYVGCSVLRSYRRTMMPVTQIDAFVNVSGMILSALGKHAELLDFRESLASALLCVDEVAALMASAPEALSRRETEVCARTLCGMSSFSIGRDLDIGEESVKTYRKRAYSRLGVATARELLIWYISRCGRERLSNQVIGIEATPVGK